MFSFQGENGVLIMLYSVVKKEKSQREKSLTRLITYERNPFYEISQLGSNTQIFLPPKRYIYYIPLNKVE